MPRTERRGRPRVLFAIGGLSPVGGSERQLTEVMRRLHPEHVQAVLVTTRPELDGPRRRMLLDVGVRLLAVHEVDAHRLLRPPITAGRYRRVLDFVAPDVVYPWLEETSVFLVPLARLRRLPAVVARRSISGANVERNRLARTAIRRAERMAQVVTGNSEAVIREAEARGVSADRLQLVRNGHPPLPPLPPASGVAPTMGYLANFRAEKGHARFVRALAQLPRDLKWGVSFGGDGVTMDSIRAEVAQLGLTDRVSFRGRIEDPRAFWADCDVGVLLSDHEGSPNALIEAAFAGRPLIGTRVGGIPEIVADAGGHLVDPDDVRGTTAALIDVLAGHDRRARMGIAAHALVSQRFDMCQSVDGHLTAILRALGIRR